MHQAVMEVFPQTFLYSWRGASLSMGITFTFKMYFYRHSQGFNTEHLDARNVKKYLRKTEWGGMDWNFLA
jgi:hypothetical protein